MAKEADPNKSAQDIGGISNKMGWDEMVLRTDRIRALEKKIVKLKQNLVKSVSVGLGINTEELTFLLMRIGPKSVAIPVYHIEEVVQMPALVPLDRQIPSVMGLVDFHGKMVAVIDFKDLLGMGKSTISIDKCLVIFSLEPHKFAIVVDEAADVITVRRKSIQASDEVLPGMMRAAGVLRLKGGKTVLLFDVASIALSIELLGIDAPVDNIS